MFETKKQLKEIINQLNSKIRELKDYSSDYSKLFMQATELNKDYHVVKEENEALKKQNKTLEVINCKLKSQLDELVDLSIKNSLAIVSRCQKLNDENKQLKEENEALTRCVEKGMDCIDISLLEQVSKLEGENRLLNHKLYSMKDQLSVLTNEREKQKIKAYHYDMYRNSLAEECVFKGQ